MNADKFSILYNNIEEPEIQHHDGVNCYFDPIREKYVTANPEEKVRQKILRYLLKNLKVHKQAIEVEFRLSKAGITSSNQGDRADIVIFEYNKADNTWIALCVIECKAPNIMLTDEVINQAAGYAFTLNTRYMVVVNGIESISYIYNKNDDTYHPIKKLPTYKDMITCKGELFINPPEKSRFSFNELDDNCRYYIDQYPVFASETNNKLLPLLTNFYECLILDTHKIPSGKYKHFDLVEDYGTRFLKAGNSSGYGYSGEYRSFRIKKDNNIFFMNLSVFDYGITHSIITVSIDRNGHTHNALQYSEKNIVIHGDTYHFIHNGSITVGKHGSSKRSEFQGFIAKNAPYLLKDGKIDLGILHNNKLIQIDDPEMIALVENMLTYGLIREEYRDLVEGRYNLGRK